MTTLHLSQNPLTPRQTKKGHVSVKSYGSILGNLTRDFKHPKYRNSTELSKCIWELKDANISPVIEWSIVTKVLSKTQLNFCKLCLSEKFSIIKSLNDPNLLNKKI